MVKSFNKQARKFGIYDIDAALIPSPSRIPHSRDHFGSSFMKKTPSRTFKNSDSRLNSLAQTPFTPLAQSESKA